MPSEAALKAAHEHFLSTAIADADRIVIAYEDILPFYEGLLDESERSLGSRGAAKTQRAQRIE